MKTQLIQTAIAALTLAVSGYAQHPPQEMKVTVPFDFAVASRVLPAGQYTFSKLFSEPSSTRALVIQSAAGAHVVTFANPVESPRRQEIGKLVFHRYGDRYFLSEVWNPDLGSQLPASAQERKLAQNLREAPATRIVAAR
jgi:hypothetical protein